VTGTSRPLALWAVPRSVSTAFERMMIERGDHTVLTEPFSVAYYFGPERRSARFAGRTLPDSTYDDVLEAIAGGEPPVFFKDMATHLGGRLTPETLGRWTNSFLIRDPAFTLPSLARVWPDFTDDEAGYAAQRHAFDAVAELTGAAPVVIDSDDLRARPPEVVAAWCAAMEIDFDADALTWESGMLDQWRLWEDWFASTARTTGFVAPEADARPPAVDAALQRRIDQAREHYEALRAHRLRP